jgi:hypothetical protein
MFPAALPFPVPQIETILGRSVAAVVSKLSRICTIIVVREGRRDSRDCRLAVLHVPTQTLLTSPQCRTRKWRSGFCRNAIVIFF